MQNSEHESSRKEIRALQFFDFHRCSTIQWQLLGLSLSVDELASRIDAPVRNWIEDGFGPAKGFVVRLTSSLIVGVEEIEQYDSRTSGASVIVDSAELAIVGPEKLIEEAKNGLQLSDFEIVQSATIEDRARAAELVEKIMVEIIQGSRRKVDVLAATSGDATLSESLNQGAASSLPTVSPSRFLLRELFWLILAVALALGWWTDREQLARQNRRLKVTLNNVKEEADFRAELRWLQLVQRFELNRKDRELLSKVLVKKLIEPSRELNHQGQAPNVH